jgi:hypothetical protein
LENVDPEQVLKLSSARSTVLCLFGGKTLSHRRCRDKAVMELSWYHNHLGAVPLCSLFLIKHSHVVETDRKRRPYQERGGPLPGQGQFRKWIIHDLVKPAIGSATSR